MVRAGHRALLDAQAAGDHGHHSRRHAHGEPGGYYPKSRVVAQGLETDPYQDNSDDSVDEHQGRRVPKTTGRPRRFARPRVNVASKSTTDGPMSRLNAKRQAARTTQTARDLAGG